MLNRQLTSFAAIKIPNTGGAFLGTPLAATSQGVGADLVIWLYYMATTGDLWRVVYRNGKWGSIKDVKGVSGDQMKTTISLTVVRYKLHNHIWFIKSDSADNVYMGYKDPLNSNLSS